jgi:hypothetical protein
MAVEEDRRMKCSLEVVAMLCACAAQPGGVVTVPASTIASYSTVEITQAKACLRRLRITWRVVAGR